MEMSKRQSVPQIFIGDYHVGGFDDLIEHDKKNRWEKINPRFNKASVKRLRNLKKVKAR